MCAAPTIRNYVSWCRDTSPPATIRGTWLSRADQPDELDAFAAAAIAFASGLAAEYPGAFADAAAE